MNAVVPMCLLALLLTACASEERKPGPGSEFGRSVREMQRAQTYNPAAGQAAQAPAGIDGARAQAALEGYRDGAPLNTRKSSEAEKQVWTARDEK